ncbi:uncharacterized protein LOC131013191 isoform X2 [Salvia miltiorrhiza]|uniref:uncharacterized protein LOC131013191 isoform X2 n=1 Tax=Salvia miltiorrhiza TaxID=226208 RepID=UPI0025AD956C|nr:uncharacterized protein LOC131013191 isoform X2 [Salvia miltiorrhiza]
MSHPNRDAADSTEIVDDVSNIQPTSAASTVIETNFSPTAEDNTNQNWKGKRRGSRSWLMYRAALGGDWAAAEALLKQDRSLASDVLTERGDRALHLAIAMKHKKFVQKLVEWMSPSELELPDMSGDNACCYAAMSGSVQIANLLVAKNGRFLVARNKDNYTPLQYSILGGERKMISFFLEKTGVDRLSQAEWFHLLLKAIASRMYDVALKILEKDGSLATVRSAVTALHVLARQDISKVSTSKTAILFKSILGTSFYGRQGHGKMRADYRLLAEKLLAEIEESMDEDSALQLLGNPPILNDAAKVGNVELIVMLIRAYPDLIRHTDTNNYSLFHIAVLHRQDNVFGLIKQTGGLKNFLIMGMDGNNNNILHLAGKLGPLNTRENMVSISAIQMQRELAWFKEVEAMVPSWFMEMKNVEEKKPREVFSEEHKELLRESEAWMRSTADCCMLIATIILTVVYAAAFTAPGGNDGETGLPILVGNAWFACFFIFEALALFGSTLCIITFWSITSSGFEEDRFLDILPYQLKFGISGLFGSLIGAISAFMSAYCLVFVGEGPGAWLVRCLLLFIYVMLVLAICGRFSELWFKMRLPKSLPRMLSLPNTQSLFSGDPRFRASAHLP